MSFHQILIDELEKIAVTPGQLQHAAHKAIQNNTLSTKPLGWLRQPNDTVTRNTPIPNSKGTFGAALKGRGNPAKTVSNVTNYLVNSRNPPSGMPSKRFPKGATIGTEVKNRFMKKMLGSNNKVKKVLEEPGGANVSGNFGKDYAPHLNKKNRQAVSAWAKHHEVNETKTVRKGQRGFGTHNGVRPALVDMNVAKTLPKQYGGTKDTIAKIRKGEMKDLTKRLGKGADRLKLGDPNAPRLSRHMIRRIQQIHDKPHNWKDHVVDKIHDGKLDNAANKFKDMVKKTVAKVRK